MAEPLKVTIDDDVETVHVDPITGTVTENQPDGGVVVRLDARKQKDDSDEDKWFANLVDEIDHGELGLIANDLSSAIKADDDSRKGYLSNAARGLDLLGIQLKEPSSGVSESSGGVDGMSSVTNPMMLDAILHGWANAQAELLPSDGPAKIANDGDETAIEDEQAEALQKGFNHFLTKVATEYYPDTSHMLLWGTYFKGSGFKKIYRCPMRRRPVSESVDAKDLIVSDTTKDLRSCARITHEIPMRPSVMKRMKLIGAYRDTPTLPQGSPTPNIIDTKIAGIQGTNPTPQRPEDQPYTIWETQCELDLSAYAPGKFKDEGIPLPYLVTMDKDTQEILAIRRDWEEDDEECTRQRMYVKYPYVPGPGFYGTGMIGILGNATAAMTAAWREALDAGMFANFPGGLIAKLGGRQVSSTIRVAPGEFEPVETNGQPIGSIVMGLPYKDVTPGLLALMDKITQQCAPLGGSAEIPASEGIQNVPVGTMLAQIEQATKVIAAAHKGMHQAQSEEFELLIDLFRREPEDFWRSNKGCDPNYWNAEKLLAALDDHKLVPISDPNVPSHIHRVAKALALLQLLIVPQFAGRLDPDTVLRRCLAAIKEDPVGLVIQPGPQQTAPDPKIVAATLKAKTDSEKNQASIGKVQLEAQAKEKELLSDERIQSADITKELIIHNSDDRKAQIAEQRNQIEADKAHGLAQDQHALDVSKHLHEVKTAGFEQTNADRTHALATDQALHDKGLGLAQHAADAQAKASKAAVDVHKALHPPKPATPAKAKTPKKSK